MKRSKEQSRLYLEQPENIASATNHAEEREWTDSDPAGITTWRQKKMTTDFK